MVLNLHGEAVCAPTDDLSLEEAFLPTLEKIHRSHPCLRIVLEHCSTRAALETVRSCGPTVAGKKAVAPLRKPSLVERSLIMLPHGQGR